MEFQHKSVLLQECIDALNIRPDGIYLDGTLGGAGHSSQIARRLTEGGRLIGVDRDRTALAAAKEQLQAAQQVNDPDKVRAKPPMRYRIQRLRSKRSSHALYQNMRT